MRLSKEDWIRKAIKLLDTEGYEAIKLDHMCEKFGVTKGSFYHHFESMGDLEREIINKIEKETIGKITEVIRSLASPREQLRTLTEFVFTVSGRTELSLRVWSMHDKLVRKMLAKLDEERVEVMRTLYIKVGVPNREATNMALLAHISWLGIQAYHLVNPDQREESIELVNTVMKKAVKGLSAVL